MTTTTETPLNAVTEAATELKALTTSRANAVRVRDAAAWSLHAHGNPDTLGVPWTHTQILAHFGTVSHDAWTKSRKRMKVAFPDRKPDYKPDAARLLTDAVAIIRLADDASSDAEVKYAAAVRAAVGAGLSQSAIAAAAGVSRQAIHTMLNRQKAAA